MCRSQHWYHVWVNHELVMYAIISISIWNNGPANPTSNWKASAFAWIKWLVGSFGCGPNCNVLLCGHTVVQYTSLGCLVLDGFMGHGWLLWGSVNWCPWLEGCLLKQVSICLDTVLWWNWLSLVGRATLVIVLAGDWIWCPFSLSLPSPCFSPTLLSLP